MLKAVQAAGDPNCCDDSNALCHFNRGNSRAAGRAVQFSLLRYLYLRTRFVPEPAFVNVLKSLDHPHVIRIFEAFERRSSDGS
ncbi:hypothetical protein AK812_SmicGene22839 [Symbiodinium microadriaticum]|uniref:Uncharacterized protein n=1 Tax=Symbiodinium microadriaticum TaxID=2951 RepID=A0A1Q9DIS2_SYMMI|nr:hypothetical protein AK812_SmicGene22839 [Symbiodinium microadriaticum]